MLICLTNLFQTRNLRTTEPFSSSGCGDLCVTHPTPGNVKLGAEYSYLVPIYSVNNTTFLEERTRAQSDCSEWRQARKIRLTASNFGLVLGRKSAPNDKMLSGLFGEKTSINAASLSYGRRNEAKVKNLYLAQYPSSHIHECGLVVNNDFPFLGATPDGKLCDNGTSGLLEIKCPYASRNVTIVEACKNPAFFLEDVDEKVQLKRTHPYYMQVQGQLLITGCSFCDFVVYTPAQSRLFVERIFPDTDFMQTMLTALSDFFHRYAHPFISNLDKPQNKNAL